MLHITLRIAILYSLIVERLFGVTIGPSAVDVVVRYWHRVGGESLVARRRGSGVRLPLGLVVARQYCVVLITTLVGNVLVAIHRLQ